MESKRSLFVLGVCAMALSAFAGQEPTYDLERMVVTPTRNAPTDSLDVPQSIATLSSDTIASTVRVDLQDYIQEIPGVWMAPSGTSGRTASNTSNRNSDYFNSGFNIRGLGGQRVLVLTDGIRQSGQGIGYGGGNLSLYDMFAIERVEVLKGPGSVLYGTDAFGGVINIISRTPRQRDEIGLNGKLAVSLDDSRNAVNVGGMVDLGDKNWGIVAGAATSIVDEPTLPDGHTPTGGDYTRQGGFVKAEIRPTKDSTFRLMANITEVKDISIFNDPSASFAGNFWMKIPFYQRKMAGAEYVRTDISDTLRQAKIGLYSQQLNRRFHRSTPYMPPFDFTVYELTETDDTINTHELTAVTDWEFGQHNVTVGADLGYDNAHLTEMQGLTTGSMSHHLKADANQLRLSLYAQDQLDIDRHSFTFGVRGDYFELEDRKNDGHNSEDGLSGSIGYLYHLDDNTSLFSTLATGFRSPDLDERYQDTTLDYFTENVTIQGNPDLKSERSYSLELGVKRDAEDGIWEAAAYYNIVTDYIGETLVSSTPAGPRTIIVKQRSNVGDVALYGFEAGWRSPKGSPWRNYANVYRTWTDASDLVAMPDWRFGYGVGYAFKDMFATVTPSLSGRTATGSYDELAGMYFAPYTVFDAQVALEYPNDCTLIVGIKNLLDKRYYEPFMSTYQPARGFFASLQMEF